MARLSAPLEASDAPTAHAGRYAGKLSPVDRVPTLGDQALERVREALASGALHPGQAVTVRSLVETLKIGFTPARETINRLTSEGLLSLGPSRRVKVPELTPERYRELLAIRLQLEPLAAVSALPHLKSTDLARLARIPSEQLAAKSRRDYAAMLALNREFHFLLYRRCQMPTLLQMIESLYLQAGPTLRLLYPGYDVDWKGGVNHQAIIKAARARDARALGAAIRRDLKDGGRFVIAELTRLQRSR